MAELTIDPHSIGLLRELVVELQEAAQTVAGGGEAENLMAEMAVGVGDDLTLWYMGIPGSGQQYVAGQLVGTVGSWVGVKRDGSSQVTWRNMRLLENIMPGLPPKQKIGTCQKCKKPFPQDSVLEVFCPKCAGGAPAVGSA